MNYPHRVRVREPGEPTLDEDTGKYTPGAATVLYDGVGDVQDGGVVVNRDPATGTPTEMADAELFIPGAVDVSRWLPDTPVDILWNPEDVDLSAWDWDADPQQDGADLQGAEIAKVIRIGGEVFLTLHERAGG